MKNYHKEITFGMALSVIFAGLLFWGVMYEPRSFLTIGIAVMIVLLGIVTLTWRTVNKKRNIENDVPFEDEFTKLAKVYAGNRAFLYSMYLWLLIFIFSSSFAKHETMLGVGILGSALIYGISLWYFKMTGEFSEK